MIGTTPQTRQAADKSLGSLGHYLEADETEILAAIVGCLPHRAAFRIPAHLTGKTARQSTGWQ